MDHSGKPCLKTGMEEVWANYIAKWIQSYRARWLVIRFCLLRWRVCFSLFCRDVQLRFESNILDISLNGKWYGLHFRHAYIHQLLQSCSMFFDVFFLILSSFCHCHLWNFVGWISVTWKAKGVNIWSMTVQNEPLNNASWEACFLVSTWKAGFSAALILVESINLCCACVNAVCVI